MYFNGTSHKDQRGVLFYNNIVDLKEVKRLYIIENKNMSINRGWKGHRIEKRWFLCVRGKMKIQVVKLRSTANEILNNTINTYILDDKSLNYVIVEPGYATKITQLENDSRVLVLADSYVGEFNDDIFIN